MFDEGGITGHLDQERASAVALAEAGSDAAPVLAWTLPADEADQLGDEFTPGFVGRTPDEVHVAIEVGRPRRHRVVRCQAGRSDENPARWRRLEFQGELAGFSGIRWIPTLMIFRDGIPMFSQPGAVPAEALEYLINQAEGLDALEVCRRVAEEWSGASAS